jgi:ABC-2 type transport system ATP-binding protein
VKQVFAGRPLVEVRAARPVDAMRALDAMPGVEKTSLFGTAVHAVLRPPGLSPSEIASRLRQAGLEVDSVDPVSPSLEDVFLDVVERAGV